MRNTIRLTIFLIVSFTAFRMGQGCNESTVISQIDTVHVDRQIKVRDTINIYQPYPGFPDILLIKTGHAPLFAELKMPNGKLSPAQEVWAMTLKIMPEVNYYIWRPKDWDKIIDILTSEPHYNEP